MRMYSTGMNGIWIGIGIFAIMIMMVIGLGGFLLGTPIGLALLTFIIVRSVYRSYKRKKMMNGYEQSFSGSYGNPFGNGDEFSSYSNDDRTDYTSTFEEEHVVNREADGFAAQYREAASDQKIFTTEDLRNAVDVDFKEV